LVGATLVLLLQDALAFSTTASGVVTGAVFALTVLFFRRGVIGTLLTLDLRRRERSAGAKPQVPASGAQTT
jgi:branched-chain amino acid transport system permease protein